MAQKKAANKEIFARWVDSSIEAKTIAESIHPAWHNCSEYARGCHARNVYQVLGKDLKTYVSFVVCWTPEGKEVGGTRTAIVLAKRLGIPVYNLALCNISSVREFVENIIENKELPEFIENCEFFNNFDRMSEIFKPIQNPKPFTREAFKELWDKINQEG